MTKRYHNIIWDCPQCGVRNWNKSYTDFSNGRYPCDACRAFCRMTSAKVILVTESFSKAKEGFRNGKLQQ